MPPKPDITPREGFTEQRHGDQAGCWRPSWFEGRMRSTTWCWMVTACLAPGLPLCAQSPAESRTSFQLAAQTTHSISVGDFLRLDLQQRRALRRSSTFLGAAQPPRRLQLAFVLDGTETMGPELAAFRERFPSLASGLRRLLTADGRLEVAVVVYRDEDAASGPVERLVPAFTEDLSSVNSALGRLRAETGSPYFNEQVDAGLFTALDKLDWRTAERDTLRWIVLCGDAPPYPEDAKDHRRYSLDDLAKLARKRGVAVQTLLAKSEPAGAPDKTLPESLAELRPDAVEFFSGIAEGTGGRFLDLADRQQVDGWLSDSVTIVVNMPAIGDEEIAALRKAQSTTGAAAIRIAVLPHGKLDDAADGLGEPGSQATAALRHKLRRVPGLQVVEPEAVSRSLAAVEDRSRPTAELLAQVAGDVRADFVVWDEFDEGDDDATFRTALYRAADGQPVAKATVSAGLSDAASRRDLVFLAAARLCVGSSRVDLQACKLEYSIVSPK